MWISVLEKMETFGCLEKNVSLYGQLSALTKSVLFNLPTTYLNFPSLWLLFVGSTFKEKVVWISVLEKMETFGCLEKNVSLYGQ